MQIASAQAELAMEQHQSMHLCDMLGKVMEHLIQETYRWRCKIALWLAVVVCGSVEELHVEMDRRMQLEVVSSCILPC